MDFGALLNGNLMSIVIFVAFAAIIYRWLSGGTKQPIWRIFTIVPLPNESRKEVFENFKEEITTLGKPTKMFLVYDGWTIGPVEMMLKRTVEVRKKRKKKKRTDLAPEEATLVAEQEQEEKGTKSVYAFLVTKASGLFSKKQIIVFASEENVRIGDKVAILQNAPVPVGHDMYITDATSGVVVTTSAISRLTGDLVAAMRMALPEMYVWANPATAAILKELQEQANIEQAEFESKLKNIT